MKVLAIRGATTVTSNNKEEILRAFIAKYGYQPDEVEQVVENTPTGTIWSVRKKVR